MKFTEREILLDKFILHNYNGNIVVIYKTTSLHISDVEQ